MRLPIVFFMFVLLHTQVSGQYFYNDLLSNTQGNAYYQLLKKQGIQRVKAFNYDANNKLIDSFNIEQVFAEDDAHAMITTTEIPNTPPTTLVSFFDSSTGKLRGTVENAGAIETKTVYTYQNNLLVSIASTTTDTVYKNYKSSEEHRWLYKNNSVTPQKMLKIKNKRDTTLIEFKYDEAGNISEEHWFTNNRETEVYYYYYNKDKLLTDIVRYHLKKQKMVADYVFEYNPQKQVTKMMQLSGGGAGYLVWKYEYLASGLKEREICYNQQENTIIGRIEYGYKKQ